MDADRLPSAIARRDALFSLIALVVVLAGLLAPPHGLLDKADRAAFAVCHRIPERTFTFAGRPIPLCARCSGTYLGCLAGLVALIARGRGRADRLPARRFMPALGLFLFLWAADGVNSFLVFFPMLPHLYEPSNLLRLATGALEGLVIAAFLLPTFNLALWRENVDGRSLSSLHSLTSWADLAWTVVAAALAIGLVASGWPPLLYPLALISGLAVVGLLGAVNTMLALVLLRREGQAASWRAALVPCLLGIALAVIEVTAIGVARSALTAHLGLPF